MVSYVESSQRLSIIEAVVHMVNRDFVSLAKLYVRMGFIPPEVDTAPIVTALEVFSNSSWFIIYGQSFLVLISFNVECAT